MKSPLFASAVLFIAGFALMDGVAADETVLQAKVLHLGKQGQWEWAEYKDRPVDAERIEVHFQHKADVAEQTLLLWQKNVKLTWPVFLNGRKLGTLTTAETAMESVLPVPAGFLADGDNTLRIEPPAAALDDIELGPVRLIDKPVAEAISGASLEVEVNDVATGTGIPCRITLTRLDGTLQPLQAGPAADVAARVGVVYLRNGRATLQVPPGDYTLYAGHGFEWSVAQETVTLQPGAAARKVTLALKHEVDTAGWVAADSHIHTLTYSGHGDALIEERMITLAGEGVELAIATDHNHHTDFAPSAASTGTADLLTTVVGNEVTTQHGHFNAFPILPGAAVVDSRRDDWPTLVAAMRATPGVKVITLNHPRDMHSGFIPFGGIQFHPGTGNHRQEDALRDVNALEVITSGALQSDIQLLYRDWFALLNHGLRLAAIGSSDSHDVSRYIVGQGRTYVAVNDADPAKLILPDVWQSYQQGRLLPSLGLLANIRVDGKFGVGDLATGLGKTLQVRATVFGPSWVTADRVSLYANGILIRDSAIAEAEGRRGGEKASLTWELPSPAHDVHLVVIATGPGVTAPYWEIPRPYQPTSKDFKPKVIGSTNPVWIDADGDGQFQSSRDYAGILVRESRGDAAKLKAALKGYDESVAIQAWSMVRPEVSASPPGPPGAE